MSATMDVDHFSQYFNQAPVLYLEGRLHPIEVHCIAYLLLLNHWPRELLNLPVSAFSSKMKISFNVDQCRYGSHQHLFKTLAFNILVDVCKNVSE